MLYRMVRPGSPAQAFLPCNISLQQAHTARTSCSNYTWPCKLQRHMPIQQLYAAACSPEEDTKGPHVSCLQGTAGVNE